MVRVACVLIGYVFGLFQTGYLYGKQHGVDIRTMGSGNAGSTNVLRNLGLKAGLITMCGDMLKCILAVTLTWAIFHGTYPDMVPLLKIWTAAGCILGHDYPFYMHFKGGKGIACTGGMIIAFGSIPLILIGIVVFFGLFFTTHLVSLCSLSLSLSFMIGVYVLCATGQVAMPAGYRMEMCVIVTILTALAYFQHRANIGRLIHGNERHTYLTKKSDQ